MHKRMVQEMLGFWVFAYDASTCPFLVANYTFQLVGGSGLKIGCCKFFGRSWLHCF